MDEAAEYAVAEIALGPHLAKATVDSYTYLAGLKNGERIGFESARWDAGSPFVLLEGVNAERTRLDHGDLSHGRGLQVAIDHIAWVIDADS